MTNPLRNETTESPANDKRIEHEEVDIASDKTSTLPYISGGLVTLILLIGGFGFWAYSAQIDGAVIANARFAVESKRKTIRHLQGGIVKDILIGEGDRVTAGQVLLTLDATVDKANFSVIDAELKQLSAQRKRLVAELSGEEDLEFIAPIAGLDSNPRLVEIQAGQLALFLARLESRRSGETIRNKRIVRLDEEISGIQKQIVSNDLQITLIEKELVGLRKLAKRKLVPRSRLLALEREAERLRGQSAALQVNIARASNSIGEIELEGVQAKRQFSESVNEEIRAIEPRITALTEQKVAAGRRLDLIDVKAPTDGFVVSLKANTKGGVIRPGDDIMEIVPQGDRLVLEARVPTIDVDKIKAGDVARVQLNAFDQAKTPEASGKVLSVSADGLEDNRTGEEYFLARLELDEDQPASISGLSFVAGMPATVFIQTGKRTPLSYLLQPLNDRLVRTFVEGS